MSSSGTSGLGGPSTVNGPCYGLAEPVFALPGSGTEGDELLKCTLDYYAPTPAHEALEGNILGRCLLGTTTGSPGGATVRTLCALLTYLPGPWFAGASMARDASRTGCEVANSNWVAGKGGIVQASAGGSAASVEISTEVLMNRYGPTMGNWIKRKYRRARTLPRLRKMRLKIRAENGSKIAQTGLKALAVLPPFRALVVGGFIAATISSDGKWEPKVQKSKGPRRSRVWATASIRAFVVGRSGAMKESRAKCLEDPQTLGPDMIKYEVERILAEDAVHCTAAYGPEFDPQSLEAPMSPGPMWITDYVPPRVVP